MRVLAIISVVLSAAAVQAAPLNIGGTLFPAPPEPDPVGAVLVAGGAPLPFASGTYSGTLTSTVLTNDVTNPFGPNALTFTYLLTNNANSVDGLERLSVNGYTGFLTDASYQVPTAGLPPTLADRLSADVVGFSFIGVPVGPGVLAPGQTSALLVVQTNATTYNASFASVLDGTISSVATYAPLPEPGSLALLALGVLAMARRRVN